MHFPHVEEYVEGYPAANVEWGKQVVEILWSNYGAVIVSDCSETVSGSHPCRVVSVSYEQPRRCHGRGQLRRHSEMCWAFSDAASLVHRVDNGWCEGFRPLFPMYNLSPT